MLTIGSHALVAQGFDIGRTPKDRDCICTYDEYSAWLEQEKGRLKAFYPISGNKFVAFHACSDEIYEFEIAWPGSTADYLRALEHPKKIASPEACLALKLSHRYLKNSPAFLKTMKDIWLLRNAGIVVPEYLHDWLKRRE